MIGIAAVEYRHRVGVVLALYGDVVGWITIAKRKAVLFARDNIYVSHFAEVNGSLVAPADNQFVQVLRLELTNKAYRVLTSVDIRETTRTIRRARNDGNDVGNLDTECRCPIRIESDMQLTRLLAP